MTPAIVQVSVLNTRRDYFEYTSDTPPTIGARVWVPFRSKLRLGIVTGLSEKTPAYPLKSIATQLDDHSFLTEEIFALCRWISRYYHAPLPLVLIHALPKRFRLGKPLTTRRLKTITPANFTHDPHHSPKVFNAEQKVAFESIVDKFDRFHCSLLYGVTGSGKTEIYLQLAEKILSRGQQVLILVPEIGLTPQLVSRFSERFQEPVAVLHSDISEAQKAFFWHQAKENKIRLVIGTRTALFTPMPQLKLIIVDEEHDASFKQTDGVRFSARDAAIFRAQLNHIPIVLGSATPSIESLYHCQMQKYSQFTLTQSAQNPTPLYYQFVDLRRESVEGGIAVETRQLIEKTLQNKQQVLIFINRRGYAPVLLCHACRWIADCTACDSHLTLHHHDQLICHHCGMRTQRPTHCPQCSEKTLIAVGQGTQRIQETLIDYFPETPIIRIDRDEIKTKDAFQTCLTQIASGTPQIIIGTQMLAKGHHFPNLSLVVILDTDAALYNQDFRALERLGQLITQVAGRAGRAEEPGHIVIQTHMPDHPLLNLLAQKGYSALVKQLLPLRQASNWPPFSYLALIRAHGKTMRPLLDGMHAIKAYLKNTGLTLLGPAPAPLARKNREHHLQLLLKASDRKILHKSLHSLGMTLEQIEKTYNMRCSIDVDPISLT
jgi:primosomal protein N' (replication factor Y) (superfamily II helicase)